MSVPVSGTSSKYYRNFFKNRANLHDAHTCVNIKYEWEK